MINIVNENIEDYAEKHINKESSLFKELIKETYEKTEVPQMSVGHLQGSFLKMLVKITNAKSILEIGTFTGYSTLSMAEGLPEDGEIITLDKDTVGTVIAKKYWAKSSHGKKIKLIMGRALESLKKINTKFDLVFIDADKDNYINYYESSLEKLNQGGLIVADNVLWSGRVLDPKDKTDIALDNFNKYVKNDKRVECVLLTLRDGLMLIRKK